MKKDIKNTLCKIGNNEIAFTLWGLCGGDFNQLTKNQIKAIITNLHKATKEEQKELKKLINQWCENCRCYSLIQK